MTPRDLFSSVSKGRWLVLPSAVDVAEFVPKEEDSSGGLYVGYGIGTINDVVCSPLPEEVGEPVGPNEVEFPGVGRGLGVVELKEASSPLPEEVGAPVGPYVVGKPVGTIVEFPPVGTG